MKVTYQNTKIQHMMWRMIGINQTPGTVIGTSTSETKLGLQTQSNSTAKVKRQILCVLKGQSERWHKFAFHWMNSGLLYIKTGNQEIELHNEKSYVVCTLCWHWLILYKWILWHKQAWAANKHRAPRCLLGILCTCTCWVIVNWSPEDPLLSGVTAWCTQCWAEWSELVGSSAAQQWRRELRPVSEVALP